MIKLYNYYRSYIRDFNVLTQTVITAALIVIFIGVLCMSVNLILNPESINFNVR